MYSLWAAVGSAESQQNEIGARLMVDVQVVRAESATPHDRGNTAKEDRSSRQYRSGQVGYLIRSALVLDLPNSTGNSVSSKWTDHTTRRTILIPRIQYP